MVPVGSGTQIVDAARVDPRELAAMLDEAYGPAKRRFLIEHGDWWYRGTERLVILHDGSVAGYSGVIPTTCLVEGRELPALWAVDLYVSPRFRGLGLQRVITDVVHGMTELHLAFANDLSAQIYRKQRGGRVRSDFGVLILPLRPREVEAVKRAEGPAGALLRAGAAVATPLARTYWSRVAHYRPRYTEIMGEPDPAILEGIFRNYTSTGLVTTVRGEDFLRWRYLEAPYRSELSFYVAGRAGKPSCYAIVRCVMSGGQSRSRILDIFGDLKDEGICNDLFRTIARDADAKGATQLTVMACAPELVRSLHRVGFLGRRNANLCWTASDPVVQEQLFRAPLYWTLGDSDNDEPPRTC